MNTYTTNNPLEVLDRAHSIYTLKLLYNIVSTSVETSPSIMRATTAILDAVSGYNIILRSAFPLGYQRRVCTHHKMFAEWDANGNLWQILSADIQDMQFEIAIYKTVLMVADNFSEEALIGSEIMNHHVNSICTTDREEKASKGKILLLGSVPNDPTVKEVGVYGRWIQRIETRHTK